MPKSGIWWITKNFTQQLASLKWSGNLNIDFVTVVTVVTELQLHTFQFSVVSLYPTSNSIVKLELHFMIIKTDTNVEQF